MRLCKDDDVVEQRWRRNRTLLNCHHVIVSTSSPYRLIVIVPSHHRGNALSLHRVITIALSHHCLRIDPYIDDAMVRLRTTWPYPDSIHLGDPFCFAAAPSAFYGQLNKRLVSNVLKKNLLLSPGFINPLNHLGFVFWVNWCNIISRGSYYPLSSTLRVRPILGISHAVLELVLNNCYTDEVDETR